VITDASQGILSSTPSAQSAPNQTQDLEDVSGEHKSPILHSDTSVGSEGTTTDALRPKVINSDTPQGILSSTPSAQTAPNQTKYLEDVSGEHESPFLLSDTSFKSEGTTTDALRPKVITDASQGILSSTPSAQSAPNQTQDLEDVSGEHKSPFLHSDTSVGSEGTTNDAKRPKAVPSSTPMANEITQGETKSQATNQQNPQEQQITSGNQELIELIEKLARGQDVNIPSETGLNGIQPTPIPVAKEEQPEAEQQANANYINKPSTNTVGWKERQPTKNAAGWKERQPTMIPLVNKEQVAYSQGKEDVKKPTMSADWKERPQTATPAVPKQQLAELQTQSNVAKPVQTAGWKETPQTAIPAVTKAAEQQAQAADENKPAHTADWKEKQKTVIPLLNKEQLAKLQAQTAEDVNKPTKTAGWKESQKTVIPLLNKEQWPKLQAQAEDVNKLTETVYPEQPQAKHQLKANYVNKPAETAGWKEKQKTVTPLVDKEQVNEHPARATYVNKPAHVSLEPEDTMIVHLSGGCGLAVPEYPKPGQYPHRFDINFEDDSLGIIPRHYHMQIPEDYLASNDEALPLVFDLHGWHGSSDIHSVESPWRELGLEEKLILVWPHGNDDGVHGKGSFNCAQTDGPMGPICDTNRTGYARECYPSCPNCDPKNSCDWTSCADDIGYIHYLVEEVTTQWCVDLGQMHITGFENGGMFTYYLASQEPNFLGFASVHPVSASPLLGFGSPPEKTDTPIDLSILDIHGLLDDTIPYLVETSMGVGPYNTLISSDGYYYEDKRNLLNKWAEAMHCSDQEEPYPTHYDDPMLFKCWVKRCELGNSLVHCVGGYGHEYPLGRRQGEETSHKGVAEVAWNFMKGHPKQVKTIPASARARRGLVHNRTNTDNSKTDHENPPLTQNMTPKGHLQSPVPDNNKTDQDNPQLTNSTSQNMTVG